MTFDVRETTDGPWHTAQIDGWGYRTACGHWIDYADLADLQPSVKRDPQCPKCKAQTAKSTAQNADTG